MHENIYILEKTSGLYLVKRYFNVSTNFEWSLTNSEIDKIIDDVNSIYYYKFKQLQQFCKSNTKKIRKLISKRNKMVIIRIESCMRRKKNEIIKNNLSRLKLIN